MTTAAYWIIEIMIFDKKYIETYKANKLDYYVMFNGDDADKDAPYSPLVDLAKITDPAYKQGHLFDMQMNGILPALRYILHLPRGGLDTVEISVKAAFGIYESADDAPHDIRIFPSYMSEEISNKLKKNPVKGNGLMIYEDSCEDYIKFFDRNDFLDIVPISRLSSNLLKMHWSYIYDKVKEMGKECAPDSFELLEGDKFLATSLLILLKNLGMSRKIFELKSSGTDLYKQMYSLCLNAHRHIQIFNDLEKDPENEKNILAGKTIGNTNIPIALTMLGRPAYQKKVCKNVQQISDAEREVARILAVHRACAEMGVVVELEDATSELYGLLEQLEAHCKGNIKNTFVWDTLRKIGKKLTENIGIEKKFCLGRARRIAAFTDFPIGLAILSEGTSPLCCYTSISYKPITPLTKALQAECVKTPMHYISDKCKIVIAECLALDDPIRGLSRGGWEQLIKQTKNQPKLNIMIEDIASVEELKKLLRDNSDTDILIISAHGVHNKKSNIAGLCIGNEIWMGEDDDVRMPPLVMLSACHTAPRGTGTVNVSDLLLRAGAMAVLGSFIPVQVHKNAMLFIRFISYIHAAIEGDKTYKTLLDAWTGVAANNAINEILHSNKKLLDWAMKPRANGMPPLVEFMLHSSQGRLRGSSMYDDTIKVLHEMLAEDGLGDFFDSIIKSQGFFPESLFYQMVGSPEKIYIYHPMHERLLAKDSKALV